MDTPRRLGSSRESQQRSTNPKESHDDLARNYIEVPEVTVEVMFANILHKVDQQRLDTTIKRLQSEWLTANEEVKAYVSKRPDKIKEHELKAFQGLAKFIEAVIEHDTCAVETQKTYSGISFLHNCSREKINSETEHSSRANGHGYILYSLEKLKNHFEGAAKDNLGRLHCWDMIWVGEFKKSSINERQVGLSSYTVKLY